MIREHEQLLQEQAEQLKLKDNERYELLVTNEQLSQEALDASDATKRAKADKTRMVSELETMKENIQDQMDRVRVEERRLVQEALEAELRESVKISIREAVASAQESLLCEIEQLTLENLAAEQRLAEQENAHLGILHLLSMPCSSCGVVACRGGWPIAGNHW